MKIKHETKVEKEERIKRKNALVLERLRRESLEAIAPDKITDKGALIRELVEALSDVYSELHFLIKDEQCEHSANICWCEAFAALDKAKSALAKAKAERG